DPEARGTRHNFGGGDTLLRFRVGAAPSGSVATIVLQWSNRFGAAGDDYDLCVRQTTGVLVGCSSHLQNGNDDPLETMNITCTGPSGTGCAGDIQITLFQGSVQALALFCQSSEACMFDEFNVRGGSVVGHKAVLEVLAVAASPASNPSIVEPYSSAGPSIIAFPSPAERPKPDLGGIDCVKTSRPGFNPFCGTSAAAPHVAGVAAILMQAMGSGSTPAGVRQVLKATAVDLGPAGADSDFGAGRADALAAVQSVAVPANIAVVAAVLPSSRAIQVG